MKEGFYDFTKMILQSTIISLMTVLIMLLIQDFNDGADKLGEIDQFVQIARIWADEHKYNETGYNCINYSRDLYEIAQILDIDAEQMTGCPPEDSNETCHRWLRITLSFEPQKAQWVD